MVYKVEFIEEAIQDFKKLDRSQQILIRKSILKIEKYGMQVGEALRGELSGCRKLKHKKAGLRVVFRETKKGLEIIQILAIGKRSDKEVYKSATKRL
ncbi:addiction module toxin RelE [Marinilactibacillus sp. 15R]|uniref:type II toxin-antitoxin system RelE family toxin n=1 Tax=Marinilactibacillus sp. 15R TaxID=1911586 RepID=UPI00090BDF2E|nr:addiction module toxin RelE [Marinilactibacillus sp. 15R]API88042.1 addiction module toxin RelE [Marinilactibacillus sp. 15R]